MMLLRDFTVRELKRQEIPDALSLVWRVFQQYEAPDYTAGGAEEFRRSICDAAYVSALCAYGAFDGSELVGVIATLNEGAHIALFFVRGDLHRKGIGKRLFKAALDACRAEKMTVNSSPYAVPVYHKLGFLDTGRERVVNGLRFTPMERTV